jgi:hypothetical protein
MRICVLVLYTEGWSDIARVVIPNLSEYCLRHGYVLEDVSFRGEYPLDFGYNKLVWIKKMFEANEYDIIWSLDLDTLITNHNNKVEDFIEGDKDFYITKDVNGINGGSFIIKNSKWSLFFLELLIGLKGQKGMHCEQDAIRTYYESHANEKIKILPHPSINSYDYSQYPEFPEVRERKQGHWHKGDFVLHLPGMALSKRLQILKQTEVEK